MQWFRWYHGSCEDGKFRMVARNARVTVATVIGVWAALLEDASHPDHRGVATRGEDFYAAVLDLEPGQVEVILGQMHDVGLISVGMGAITVCRWKERQFETDVSDPTNADRQRRHREKKKARPSNDSETPHNGTVTAMKRPDTDTDTDTELDTAPIGAGDLVAVEPPDLRKSIFDDCLPWLAKASGKAEGPLRGMVGKWCRDHSDETVLTTIRACMRSPPVNPVAWIERNLNGGQSGKRHNPISELERAANIARQYDEAHSHGVG